MATLLLVESQQVIYRGKSYYWPKERWDTGWQKWTPYKGEVPKEAGWGDIVTEAEAKEFMKPF